MSIKRLNGVHLKHFKNTESETTVSFPLSAKVILPMGQGMGAPCEPLVNVGDKVFVGQKIGDSDKFMSVPVHSSVSGTVKELRDYALPGGRYCKAVVIESDGKQTVDETIAPPEIKTADDFIKAVRESGAVGLGGALCAGRQRPLRLRGLRDRGLRRLRVGERRHEPLRGRRRAHG